MNVCVYCSLQWTGIASRECFHLMPGVKRLYIHHDPGQDKTVHKDDDVDDSVGLKPVKTQ